MGVKSSFSLPSFSFNHSIQSFFGDNQTVNFSRFLKVFFSTIWKKNTVWRTFLDNYNKYNISLSTVDITHCTFHLLSSFHVRFETDLWHKYGLIHYRQSTHMHTRSKMYRKFIAEDLNTKTKYNSKSKGGNKRA